MNTISRWVATLSLLLGRSRQRTNNHVCLYGSSPVPIPRISWQGSTSRHLHAHLQWRDQSSEFPKRPVKRTLGHRINRCAV